MAPALVPSVERERMDPVEPVHPARHGVDGRLEHQVVMRGHQAVRVEVPLEAVDALHRSVTKRWRSTPSRKIAPLPTPSDVTWKTPSGSWVRRMRATCGTYAAGAADRATDAEKSHFRDEGPVLFRQPLGSDPRGRRKIPCRCQQAWTVGSGA